MRFLRLCLLLCIPVYLLTAVNSNGYYHPDEQYQVLEFASYKMGHTNKQDLAWEYAQQMRPGLQPAIVVMVCKTLNLAGVNDPNAIALFLRLLSGAFALTVIFYFVKITREQISPAFRNPYIVLSFFLWFLPFLNVRFSSENYSALFFLLSLVVLQQPGKHKATQFFLVGLLQGLAFCCRIQSVILSAGLLTWLLFIKREQWKYLFCLAGGGFVALVIGVMCDRWLYGVFTFTPWNYFRLNILQHAAAAFGVSPWYFFIPVILRRSFIPIGILILFSTGVLLFRNRRHYLVYTFVPFIIIHSLIGHKEDRFLFPLVNFAPLLLILACEELARLKEYGRFVKWPVRIIVGGLFAINLIFLAAMCFRPLGSSSKEITTYLHRHYPNQEVNLITTVNSNPYEPMPGLRESFYEDPQVHVTLLDGVNQYSVTAEKKEMINIVCLRRRDSLQASRAEIIPGAKLKLVKESVPHWVQVLTHSYDSSEDWDVYQLFTRE